MAITSTLTTSFKKEQKPVLVDRNDSHLQPPEPNKW